MKIIIFYLDKIIGKNYICACVYIIYALFIMKSNDFKLKSYLRQIFLQSFS